jgi:hypothetical protein
VQCGAGGLDIADRQNAHSAAVAIRGQVELYRLVNRQKELHGKGLVWSVSHDNRSVRINLHSVDLENDENDEPQYYRHSIDAFDFTVQGGKEKWTANQYILNIYDFWLPKRFQKIQSVIDMLPMPEPGTALQSE